MLTMRPRGTNDLLPEELEKWHYVEQILHDIAFYMVIGKFAHQFLNIPSFFSAVVGKALILCLKKCILF